MLVVLTGSDDAGDDSGGDPNQKSVSQVLHEQSGSRRRFCSFREDVLVLKAVVMFVVVIQTRN